MAVSRGFPVEPVDDWRGEDHGPEVQCDLPVSVKHNEYVVCGHEISLREGMAEAVDWMRMRRVAGANCYGHAVVRLARVMRVMRVTARRWDLRPCGHTVGILSGKILCRSALLPTQMG